MNLIFGSNCRSRTKHAKLVVNFTFIYQTNLQMIDLKFTEIKTNHEKHVVEAELMQSNLSEITKLCKLNPEKFDVIALDSHQTVTHPHLQVFLFEKNLFAELLNS